MERWSVILAAAALLLVPVTAAHTLELDVRGVDADEARLEGHAPVVHADNGNGTQMLLRAQRVHVEQRIETKEPPHSAVDLSRLTGDGTKVDERGSDHEDVEWSGGLTLANAYALVTASDASLVLSAPALRVALPESDRHGEVDMRPHGAGAGSAYEPSVAGLSLASLDEARVEVRGDFTIRYWNGRLGGPTADGSAAYEAGEFETTEEPVPQNPAVRWTRDVFVTLHVQNGTLSMATPTSTELYAYLDGPARLAGARATLHGVVGTVDGQREGGSLVLEDFSFLTAFDGTGLRVWSPPPEPGPGSSVGGIPAADAPAALVAVLSLLAAAGLGLYVRVRRTVSVKTLLDHMDQRAYRRVVRQAGPVMRRTGSEAVAVMKTVALLALGRARRALRFLDALPADLRPTDGMHPFLRAHAWNELGDEEEARRSLREALGQNPDLVVELAQFPRLRALLPDDAPSEVYA